MEDDIGLLESWLYNLTQAPEIGRLLRWDILNDWGSEDPFIGILKQHVAHKERNKQIYAWLGQKPDAVHPCKPRDSPNKNAASVDKIYSQESYKKSSPAQPRHDSVQEVSRILHKMFPEHSGNEYHFRQGPLFTQAVRNMTAEVCRQIVANSPQVESAIPVILNLPGVPASTTQQDRDRILSGWPD